jgi:hypothetical protein
VHGAHHARVEGRTHTTGCIAARIWRFTDPSSYPLLQQGVLSTLMRDLGNIATEHPKWIVLDGDIDPNWIESMNSVMDDNKVTVRALKVVVMLF